MGLILWIIFGAVAGWIASAIMKRSRQGLITNIILGIIGAIIGGFIMGTLGQGGITGFNLYSLFIAIIGAIIFLYIGRLLRL